MTYENQRRADRGDGTFRNPIFGSDFPDPSICKVDDSYYLTHSSFVYRPGLLIWSSRDLVNWQPVTHAVDHRGWSIWAPEIVHHQGRFYIYYFAPKIEGPWEGDNWVVWADDVAGPWSAPIRLGCGHIDPGHVVGPDGRRYLHLSGGHIVDLHENGLELTSEARTVYDGWPMPSDWRIEGTALEGPKLLKRGDWYYLISAQGGTAGPATSHMVIAARSKSPQGPWENSPYNPIVRTTSRRDRWYSRGHGTLFEGPDEQWWMIYHGYEKGFHTLGRQTLIEPMQWTADGWFHAVEAADVAAPMPAPAEPRDDAHYMPLSDDWGGDALGMQWQKFASFDDSRVRVGDGRLTLDCAGSIQEPSRPLTCTPVDLAYEVELEVDTSEMAEGDAAGLVLYYDERCFAGLLAGPGQLVTGRSAKLSGSAQLDGGTDVVALKLVNDRNELEMFYREGQGQWRRHPTGLDVSGYHHNVFGRFLSLRVGLMAVGAGQARLVSFRYRGLMPGNDLPEF